MLRLSAPRAITFWLAVALAIIGLVFFFVPALAAFAFWALLVGFIILMVSNLLKGW